MIKGDKSHKTTTNFFLKLYYESNVRDILFYFEGVTSISLKVKFWYQPQACDVFINCKFLIIYRVYQEKVIACVK